MSIEFELNGSKTKLDPQPETALLWVLREHLKLTGTKFGCGSVSYTHLTLPTKA